MHVLFFSGHCEIDFVVLIDCSSSIGFYPGTTVQDPANPNWQQIKDMTEKLVRAIDQNSKLGDTSRLSLFTWSSPPAKEIIGLPSGYDIRTILPLVRNLEYRRGTTYMMDAFERGVSHLTSNVRDIGGGIKATQVIVMFTDGKSTNGNAAAYNVRRLGLEIRAYLKSLMDNRGIHVVLIGEFLKFNF